MKNTRSNLNEYQFMAEVSLSARTAAHLVCVHSLGRFLQEPNMKNTKPKPNKKAKPPKSEVGAAVKGLNVVEKMALYVAMKEGEKK